LGKQNQKEQKYQSFEIMSDILYKKGKYIKYALNKLYIMVKIHTLAAVQL